MRYFMVMFTRICVITWLCCYARENMCYALLNGYARENMGYCMVMIVRIYVIVWLCSREYALLYVYARENMRY